MTVTADRSLAGLGLCDLVSRTESLLQQQKHFAGWWVELANLLDEIGERALNIRDETPLRLAEQLRFDAPHMFPAFHKLESEANALMDEVLRVRRAAGSCAGDPSPNIDIPQQVRSVLRRLRRLESHSNSVVLDAYERDIGGE